MVFSEKDIQNLKLKMLNKYGKTSYSMLANELNVTRDAIYKAIKNDKSLDKLRCKLVEWIEK